MFSAKDITVKVIRAGVGNEFVKRLHYSGKAVQNSKLHFGVFLNERLHGVMSFGPSLDKRKVLPLVKGTLWNEMLELNRMAFDDVLPKNSESRAIAIAMKLIRKNAPHIKWVISFADGTQCGDGTIYRASGFVLTAIKENTQSYEMPTSAGIKASPEFNASDPRWAALVNYAGRFRSMHTMFLQGGTRNSLEQKQIRALYREMLGGRQSMRDFMARIGGKAFIGYQLRYIYFVHPNERQNLTVPVLPFSEIDRHNARMYKGVRVTSIDSDAAAFQVA